MRARVAVCFRVRARIGPPGGSRRERPSSPHMRGFRGPHHVVDPETPHVRASAASALPGALPGAAWWWFACGWSTREPAKPAKCVVSGVRTASSTPTTLHVRASAASTPTAGVLSQHLSRNCTRIAQSGAVPGQVWGNRTRQETAAFTRSTTVFSTAGLHPISAYDTGHMSPSSRFAVSWKPRVEYR